VARLGIGCAAFLAALSVACESTQKTELTITWANAFDRREYRLLCDPPTGNLPNPSERVAC
jgi:hypothetical protein